MVSNLTENKNTQKCKLNLNFKIFENNASFERIPEKN